MLNTKINIVAIVVDIKDNLLSKSFISINENIYEPINLDVNNCEDCSSISECLAETIGSYLIDLDAQLLQYHLLSCSKQQDCIFINYAVIIPGHVRLADHTILKSYNVSIVNPIVRKALAYV